MHRTGWAGWAGWLAYKVPYAACRKIPCPSAAAQRAVGGVVSSLRETGSRSRVPGRAPPKGRSFPSEPAPGCTSTANRSLIRALPQGLPRRREQAPGFAAALGSIRDRGPGPQVKLSHMRCRGAARPARPRTARVALRLLRVGNRGFGTSPTLARPTGCRGGAAPWARPIVYYLRPNRYDLNQDRERLPVRH